MSPVCIRGYKCKRPVDDTVATQKKCNRISTIPDNLAMTVNQEVYGRASERIRSFLVTSQHMHRTFLPRHGRIPLGRVPRARQLDLTIRRRRKDDVMSGQRVCVPPRGRVEVDEEKRKEVHQKSQTLTRRKRSNEFTVGRAKKRKTTHLYIPRTYVTWSIPVSWTASSSSSVADMNKNLPKISTIRETET